MEPRLLSGIGLWSRLSTSTSTLTLHGSLRSRLSLARRPLCHRSWTEWLRRFSLGACARLSSSVIMRSSSDHLPVLMKKLTPKVHRQSIAPAIAKSEFFKTKVDEIMASDGFRPSCEGSKAYAGTHPPQYEVCAYYASVSWYALLRAILAGGSCESPSLASHVSGCCGATELQKWSRMLMNWKALQVRSSLCSVVVGGVSLSF